MTVLEQLKERCIQNQITVQYDILPYDYTGMLVQLNGVPDLIIIDNSLSPTEQTVVLAEHLGYFLTCRDIKDHSERSMKNSCRQRAKVWSYITLLPLSKFIDAMNAGVKNKKELAAYCELTEKFIFEAVKYYKEKYGEYARIGNYAIFFEPLGILRFF